MGVTIFRSGRDERQIITLGKTRNDEQGKTVDEECFFDLASLTKPLATALGILSLIERNVLTWESRVGYFLPFTLPAGLTEITVDQVLTHSAGLLAYKPCYTNFPPVHGVNIKDKLIQAFLAEQKAYSPGETCLYSDVGYLLLGTMIEQLTGQPLDEFFRMTIAEPLGVAERIAYRRLREVNYVERKVVATELCPWRQRMLQGEVHDEHAWLMDGVAGHAGLFGTIAGVLTMTTQLLRIWKGRQNHPGFSQEVLKKALTKKYRDRSWCRGFDTPAARGSSAGTFFSEGSVGHLGFTGTSFWIDPKQEVVVVLLSNRVHPTRHNERIKEFRPIFHNAVMRALQE